MAQLQHIPGAQQANSEAPDVNANSPEHMRPSGRNGQGGRSAQDDTGHSGAPVGAAWESELRANLGEAFASVRAPKAKGLAAHRAAKESGSIIQRNDELEEVRAKATRTLGGLLSADEVMRACKLNMIQIQREHLSADDLVQHLRKLLQGWSADSVRNRTSVLIRLQQWLATAVPGSTIHSELSAVTMQRFFTWVHQTAEEAYKQGKSRRDGTRAAQGAYESILFFEANWGFTFAAKDCRSSLPYVNKHTGSRAPVKDARPFSIGIVALLLEFVANQHVDPTLRHLGCGLLIMAYTGLRYAQIQSWVLYGQREDEIYGQSFKKDPRHGHREDPAPFWLVLVDITGRQGPARFMEVWRDSVDDLLKICEDNRKPLTFAIRSFSRSSKHKPAEMHNGPISYDQLRNNMWRVLVAACPGMSEEVAKSFTPHSARHFLQCVFKSREECHRIRALTGEWSGWASTQQTSACVWAPDQIHTAAVRRFAKMADRYAQHALAREAIGALRRNLEAVRRFVSNQGGAMATFQQECFSADGVADTLHFDRLEKEARVLGEKY